MTQHNTTPFISKRLQQRNQKQFNNTVDKIAIFYMMGLFIIITLLAQ